MRRFCVLTWVFVSLMVPLQASGITVSLDRPPLRFVFIGHPQFREYSDNRMLIQTGRMTDHPDMTVSEGTQLEISDDGTTHTFAFREVKPGDYYLGFFLRIPLAGLAGGSTGVMLGGHFYDDTYHTYLTGISSTAAFGPAALSGFIGAGFHRYHEYVRSKTVSGPADSITGAVSSWAAPAWWWGGDIELELSRRISINGMVSGIGASRFRRGTLSIDGRRAAGASFDEPVEVSPALQYALGLSFRL